MAGIYVSQIQLKPGPENLRMGKRLKMIEGIIINDSFWS